MLAPYVLRYWYLTTTDLVDTSACIRARRLGLLQVLLLVGVKTGHKLELSRGIAGYAGLITCTADRLTRNEAAIEARNM